MIVQDDCLITLKALADNSLDSLVTDPPAGIGFMGKDWDKDKGGRDAWVSWMTEVMAECLRVLKPGAHGLVWALPRTSHWTATALENAGFEVRDVITHLFGTGFPKSLDISKAIDKAAGAGRSIIGLNPYANKGSPVSKQSVEFMKGTEERNQYITAPTTDAAKQWQGWGTALKPASEHWILVRKPLAEKTVAGNVLKHGTGGINIDGCRIAGAIPQVPQRDMTTIHGNQFGNGDGKGRNGEMSRSDGRFPSNLVLSHNEDCDEECTDGCAVAELDGQSGVTVSHTHVRKPKGTENRTNPSGWKESNRTTGLSVGPTDSGGASRFFYCAKASKSDRGEGNVHPTVKSTKLMSYLIKLITPPGGTVLDPFAGSGSTGVAALSQGFGFLGIESDAEYCEIARKRLLGIA
jgi:DNA modification methylase